MTVAKKNPHSVGAEQGRVLQVEQLRGNTNYSKLREALQGEDGMQYDVSVYRQRTAIDDWFSVFGLSHLTKAEYFVLRFILARTVHYGKTSEIIFKSHFLEGIIAGGEWKAAPCGVNSRDLYASIDSLEGKGLVSTTRVSTGSRHLATLYTVHVDAILSLRGRPDMALKTPKKARQTGVPIGTNHPPKDRCQLAPKNSIKENLKTNSDDGGRLASPHVGRVRRVRPATTQQENAIDCKSKILSIAQKAAQLHAPQHLEKVRRGRAAAPGAITLTDLNATWKRCMVQAFGKCAVGALTHVEYGVFKKIVKAHDISFPWVEFFEWIIGSWSALNDDHKRRVDYARKKEGGWPPTDDGSFYLGTETPMLSSVVKNLVKLSRIYTDNRNRAVSRVTSDAAKYIEEAERQRVRAEKAEKALQKVSSLRSTRKDTPAPARRQRSAVATIARPEDDDYFAKDDQLPDWEAQG